LPAKVLILKRIAFYLVNKQNKDNKHEANSGNVNADTHSARKIASSDLQDSATTEGKDLCHQLRLQLQQGQLLVVNPRRKNGLILYKTYHAEFAGPGAIVGGQFDLDVSYLLAVGNLSLIAPGNSQARKQAYKMRRQWVRLTKQIIDNPQPTERAQVILNQFEHWFDIETVADLPDEAFALLVGVLPQTIRKVRNIELL